MFCELKRKEREGRKIKNQVAKNIHVSWTIIFLLPFLEELSMYCSVKCQQRTAWRAHKPVCQKVRGGQESTKPTTADELTQALEENAASSSTISQKSPSVLSDPIRAALQDPRLCYFFRIGDVTSTRLLEEGGGSYRFLATIGVLT